MAYRRTENVLRRLAARHDAIVAAARDAAGEGGMAAIQIAPVAARAGIAAGTVYRYFPGKTDLVGALVESVSEREIGAMRRAADAAPGPLSALAAAITTFAARALRHRRLAWAVIAEPVDAETDALRLAYRKAFAAELEARIKAAIAGGHSARRAGNRRRAARGPDRAVGAGFIRRSGQGARGGAGARADRAARARRGRRARARRRGAGRAAASRRRGLGNRRINA